MKIRAITIGQKIPFLAEDKVLENILERKLEAFYSLNNELTKKFNDVNIEVQTKRLCSQPILSYEQQVFEKNLNETLTRIHDQLSIIERLIKEYEIDDIVKSEKEQYRDLLRTEMEKDNNRLRNPKRIIK